MILGEDVVERLQVTEDLILVADVAIPAPIWTVETDVQAWVDSLRLVEGEDGHIALEID